MAALIRGRRLFQSQGKMNDIKCQNLAIFSFKIRMKQIFTINEPHIIMKKSKYQQYFHCFIVCILVLYAFWFSFQQSIVTILISAVLRGATLVRGKALIRGRRLFQCRYPKVRHLLQGGNYLRPGAYYRKYGILLCFLVY